MTVQTHMAWRYRNPADLIGRRCIALTGMDVTLDGPLDLIRLSPVHAVLKYRGIGLHVIDCDLRHHTNKTSDGLAPSSSRKANHETHHIACQEMA